MQSESYVEKRNRNRGDLWKARHPLLGRLDLHLTERCNNNCIHCYINLPSEDREAKSKELGTDAIRQILKEAASLGCMTVRFTGGEPFLREDFEELYVFARKQGLKVLIFTNATLLTPHLVKLFARIPPLDKIEVSVYGMKKESYEAVTRSPGSFEAAWKGINLLLEFKIPFVVKGALLPPNRDEVNEFEAWAATIPWMARPPRYSMFLDLHSRRDVDKNRLIQKLRVGPEQGLQILIRDEQNYLKEMREFCSKFIRPPGDKLFSCGLGCGSGCVDAYGLFQPCMLLGHPDMVYDLKKGSLKDALENFFPRLRETRTANPEYLARCARCFLKGFCEQCPARSWTENGTLDTPVEYLCDIAHTQAAYFGLISESEKAWEVTDWQARVRSFSAKA